MSEFYGWLHGQAGEVGRRGSVKSGIKVDVSNGEMRYTMNMWRGHDGKDYVRLTQYDLGSGRSHELLRGEVGKEPEYPVPLLPTPRA